MKPDRCIFCKSKLVEGKTEFVAKVGEQIIAVKDVSAYVCENCGEHIVLRRFQQPQSR